MKKDELRSFLQRHNISPTAFAEVVGVTRVAVLHWLSGRRTVSLTISRLCRLFDKSPDLLKEFGAA